jgi:subtilase family serine protease
MKQCGVVDGLVVAISSEHEPSSSPSNVHGVASSFASLKALSSILSSELIVDRSSSSLDHEVEQSSTNHQIVVMLNTLMRLLLVIILLLELFIITCGGVTEEGLEGHPHIMSTLQVPHTSKNIFMQRTR